ncbi:helix-turn-helix transcriptional regulator [Thalassospira sp. HF15]|uniref:AraC family transcriptional regulator n=1 Tax=Thalassospira sp. HF15 TaxID=2722755 RepID=UPI0014320678|nr:AraC family transcriptional regulator [Thalassospira sp. HF15]NIY77091.1 helix-turn-helix transcriptional regulator [Thalassospira sp. HF15]
MQYSMRQYRAEAESHSHSEFHQIIISDLGKLEMEVEGRGGEVFGRQLAFVEAGKTHAYRAEGLNRFLVIDVNADLAQRTGIEALWHRHGNAETYLEVRSGHQHGLAGLLGTLAATNEDIGPNALAWLKTLLLRSQRAPGPSAIGAQSLPPRLVRAMAWAEARLGEDITIADLASVATQSESSLFSAFQIHVGTSPMRWLTEQRLQMAMALLRDPEIHLSMSDLANAVGFSDQSAFSRAFSRRFGCAPSSVRRAIR